GSNLGVLRVKQLEPAKNVQRLPPSSLIPPNPRHQLARQQVLRLRLQDPAEFLRRFVQAIELQENAPQQDVGRVVVGVALQPLLANPLGLCKASQAPVFLRQLHERTGGGLLVPPHLQFIQTSQSFSPP